jgi:O-antigen ligase
MTLSCRNQVLPLSLLEAVLLCSVLFLLPLLEAPKNLFCLLYLLAWSARSLNGVRRGDCGFQWRKWDSIFAAFLLVTIITIAASAPFPSHWSEWGDALRNIGVAWTLSHRRLKSKHVGVLLSSVLLGTIIATAWGYWEWKVAHTNIWLELNSVGHVNHSAQYIAVVGLSVAGVCLAAFKELKRPLWLLLCLATILFCYVVLTNESRGAALGYGLGMLLIITGFTRLSRKTRTVLLLGFPAMITVVLLLNPYLLVKSEITVAEGRATSFRPQLARVALTAARQHPVLGVGPANFGELKPALIAEWAVQQGCAYQADQFFYSNHAHSVYFTTLAERGITGLLMLFVLCGAWIRQLWLLRREKGLDLAGQSVLCFSAASLTGLLVMGLFNTTFHHENGLLAMAALGMLLAYFPAKEKASVTANP